MIETSGRNFTAEAICKQCGSALLRSSHCAASPKMALNIISFSLVAVRLYNFVLNFARTNLAKSSTSKCRTLNRFECLKYWIH